ncbi:MAG: hypothetical protein LKJ64_02650 [Lentilactobacillus buchneri]|nr:hypothetical protein [Lentilactobacillus buchneri]
MLASNITGIIRHNNFLFCKSIPKLNLDLKQFLSQTLKTGFPIKIQFNNQSPAMSGKLTKLSNERYLLTNQQHNMTRIVNILEIRSIQKIK